MGSISQLKLPDNTIYNIKGSIHTVIGTQDAATGSWTGNLTSIDALYDGLTIAYYLPYAGSGNASLNLTLKNNITTGAIDCYLHNDVRITEHFKEGSVIYLTYFSAGAVLINGTVTSTARWIAQMSYEMVMLSYGHSTWDDFLAAYLTNSLVYCRASSNSNPGTGVQGRLAFMAYLNLNSSGEPTSVEFQYYRSVSSHTASQQGDQVYIYKLENKGTNGTWSVTVREAMSKIEVGTGLSSSYSNGTITLSNTYSLPTASDSILGGVKVDDSTIVIDNNGVISTSNDIATTNYVNTAINGLPTPMQFIGTVGTDGTVTWANLATPSSTNEGYTYKVITDHTAETNKPAANVGDTIISNGNEWIVVPSGDEPSGTVTSVTLKAGSGISLDTDDVAITSSGSRIISHADTSSQSSSSNSGRTYIQSVTLDDYGHVTNLSTATETVVDTDTKNTAGSTDSSDKLFLIGAISQEIESQTYSQDTAYVNTDGHLYSNSKQVVNLSDSQALTNKTYNGYTLAPACTKAVDSSILDTASTNLPTTAAITNYVGTTVETAIEDAIVIGSTEPTSASTKIWIKI